MARAKTKVPTDWPAVLREKQEALRRLRFGGAGASKVTNVRAIRQLRKEIARLLGQRPKGESENK